ncbi:MAG: hypothetical protein WC022_02765 [Parcubacteria group bacterium]
MNLNSIFSQMGISASVTQDVTLILVLILISFIFGMFVGRSRLITVLINTYVSFAILTVIPRTYLTDYNSAILIFFALLVVLTIFGKKIFEISISGSGPDFLWRVFGVSFLEVLLLVSITISLMPKKAALVYVSKTAYDYLAAPNFQLLWMIAPILGILFIHKKLNR